jgi:hypothetical protein
MEGNRLVRKLTGCIPSGRRKVGRPKMGWNMWSHRKNKWMRQASKLKAEKKKK